MTSAYIPARKGTLRAAVAGLALGLLPSPALAIDADDLVIDSTRDLYDLCSAPANDPQADNAQLLCIGYFSGAIDYHQAVIGPNFPPIVCPPEGTTRRTVIDNFVAWGGQNAGNAELMDTPPIEGAFMSAMAKWPCPE